MIHDTFLKMVVYTLVGVLFSYVMLDGYLQSKTDLSLVQMVRLAKADSANNRDINITEDTQIYYLTINGYEHNFSFTGVKFDNIKIDGLLLKKIKLNLKKEKNKNE